jgi:hypothetical protein
MRRAHALPLLLAIASLLLAIGGCGSTDSSEGAGMQPTITLAEANRKVEDYAENARRAINPALTFTNPDKQTDFPCTDPDDNGPKTRRSASVSYQLAGVAPQKIATYFEALRTWWQKTGFTVLKDEPRNEFLWGQHNEDGFQLTLKTNIKGEVFLIAGSPCVWRNGTPEP